MSNRKARSPRLLRNFACRLDRSRRPSLRTIPSPELIHASYHSGKLGSMAGLCVVLGQPSVAQPERDVGLEQWAGPSSPQDHLPSTSARKCALRDPATEDLTTRTCFRELVVNGCVEQSDTIPEKCDWRHSLIFARVDSNLEHAFDFAVQARNSAAKAKCIALLHCKASRPGRPATVLAMSA